MSAGPHKPIASLTRAERHAAGKALREAVPRAKHADLALPKHRDPLAILAETDRTRLASLVPVRYERMRASPFPFFRGGAAIMAEDLRHAPMAGLPLQACGDCHIGNFGVFQSPEGSLLFDINDFDETLPGIDFTVDVKRLATSVALAVREEPQTETGEAEAAVRACVRAYRGRVHDLAALSPLEAWAARTDVSALLTSVTDHALQEKIQGFIKAGAQGDGNGPKLAPETRDGPPSSWRLADKGRTTFHTLKDAPEIDPRQAEPAFTGYHDSLPPERRVLLDRYALRDIVFKVVGIGSVGTFCAVGLFTTMDGDTLVLQIKEAGASVLTRITGNDPFSAGNQGERVVRGQRIMQAASDVFLGWTGDLHAARQFYVRNLKNKHLGEIAPLIQDHAIAPYAELCGATLARAHARSGDMAAVAGYMGHSDDFDEAITAYALAYADQVKKDHAALVARHPS